jgi:Protein of unknown function (DUF3072)
MNKAKSDTLGRGTKRRAAPISRTEKDPEDWTTGGEPMTGPQEWYLKTLTHEAGEKVDPNLSKADASKQIDELQEKTGRGK